MNYSSPFKLPFLANKDGKNIFNNLPPKVPTSAVFKNALLYGLDEGRLIHQYGSTKRSCLELFSFDLHKELITPFEILKEAVTLHFQLDTDISFSTENGQLIKEIISKIFYAIINKPGKYNTNYNVGITNLMVITLESNWAKEILADMPLVNEILQNLNGHSKEQNKSLLSCRIDSKINKYLSSFPKGSSYKIGKLNNLIEECIIDLLEYYELRLALKMEEIWYQVKLYVDINFSDISLTITKLADDFFITERNLRDTFKAGMGITLKRYIIQLRMTNAQAILRADKSISIAEVAKQVGYEEGNFRDQYKAYFPESAEEDLRRDQSALC